MIVFNFKLLLLLALSPFFCVVGSADDVEIQEVEGVVSEVDAVGSKLVVNGLTPRGNFEQMRLVVPDDAKIYQGLEDIHLNDLDIGDSVTIKYYRDSDGILKTKEIVDNNIGNNQL
jgi:hypothetical protein